MAGFSEISSVSWGHTLSCHAKDIVLGSKLTVHLDEVRPGLSELDYAAFLTELAKLGTEVPLIIEHLESEESTTKQQFTLGKWRPIVSEDHLDKLAK